MQFYKWNTFIAIKSKFLFQNPTHHGLTSLQGWQQFLQWLSLTRPNFVTCSYRHGSSDIPTNKLHTDKSGDLGGQGKSPKREIICPGNMCLRAPIEAFMAWAVGPSCWNQTRYKRISCLLRSDFKNVWSIQMYWAKLTVTVDLSY